MRKRVAALPRRVVAYTSALEALPTIEGEAVVTNTSANPYAHTERYLAARRPAGRAEQSVLAGCVAAGHYRVLR